MSEPQGRNKGFKTENAFDEKRFLFPSSDYAPIYTWMWNSRVTREQTDRRLAEMERLGIKRFYILPMPKSFRPTSFPTPLEPEYLSDGYFEEYRYALSEAKKRGMTAWLYDEGGWPSGGACGQVMLTDPFLVQERIEVRERKARKGATYEGSEGVEVAYYNGERIHRGFTFPRDGAVDEYVRVKTSFPHVNSADLPDVTKQGATELFLKLTHEKYAAAIGDLTESGVTALFTDEPTAPRPFPYTDEIKRLFRREFGREIEGLLPVLVGREKPTAESAKIKIGFYRLLSQLFCERVLEKQKRWANERGLAFVGHLDKDDEINASVTGGNFGILRALRAFDVPGVDAIRRQIFPPKGKRGLYGENKFFPRYASSAAAQTGGRHALSESFAVYGAGVSYDEMRYALNHQAMRGVNVYNLMVIPYGEKGYEQAGLLPHFTESAYPDLAAFNLYLSRLAYLFSLGERRADVALYYPIEDGIAEGQDAPSLSVYERAGRDLERKGIPFDVIDDDLLRIADRDALKKGVIAAGRAAYTTILLPPVKYLSDEAIATLQVFESTGGKLISLSENADCALALSSIESPLPIQGAEGITYAESLTEDGTLSFLMNEGGDAQIVTVKVGEKTPHLILPSSGKILSPAAKGGKIEIEIASGEIVCLYFTERKLNAEKPFVESESIDLSDFTYRPETRLRI